MVLGAGNQATNESSALHLETLLYMLVQSDKVRPPPGATPNFADLAEQAKRNRTANEWFDVPASRIAIGLDDPEIDFGPQRYFGWDNEKPVREIIVPAFQAKARPITNQEYGQYLEHTHSSRVPASWALVTEETPKFKVGATETNGVTSNGIYVNGRSEPLTDAYLQGKAVRTVYGLVPLTHALDWPVLASFDELSGCAKWMNGRIPTAEEARTIYNHVDRLKSKEAEGVQSRTISAVNG